MTSTITQAYRHIAARVPFRPEIAVAVLLLSNALFTVDQTQYAIVLQFGEPVDVKDRPGLHIKPVAIINSLGKIRMEKKTMGFHKAISYMADKIAETALPATVIDGEEEPLTLYIAHGDCPDKVEALLELVRERIECKAKIIFIGPLIGAHTGPGSIGVFYLGQPRIAL